MDYTALGRQVKRCRQRMNLTQEKLAERCSLSASYLGHIERGTRKASLETVVELANTLDVTPDLLLSDSIKVRSPDTGLSSTQRAFMREMAKQLVDFISPLDDEDTEGDDSDR